MRIVDVNEFYSPTGGGVRTYCDRKMAILADMGHELIVVACGREDRVEERPGGGRIHYLKSPRMPFDKNYGLFWDRGAIHDVLDHYDPDVVENCSPWRPAWFVAEWQGRAIKSFFVHNDNVEAYAKRWLSGVASGERIERACAWYDRYQQRFLDRHDTVVTNGPAMTERLRRRGVRVDATMTLGIDRRHFSPELRNPRLRTALLAQCGLPADGHLLLGIGRHHPEKRWPVVIDAVQRAGAALPVGLVILGQGLDTRAIERRIGDSPHIRLFRPVYDRARLAEIMASVDGFIHGSDAEPFGLVGYEALASGAPMIVPDTGGMAEVADPLFAETYTGRDAHSCAAAIKRFFARDPALLRRAAGVAAARVRSDEDHAAELIAHYQSVIDRRLARAA
ncbi:alpha-1,6-mannosyltransferase [Sphingomonas jinjuensis]|uniref:Alpha-1,6-mannosyltransferase n=1 Tax=Sphingomonas jinjuensis TaxID=535907 RepID=A0A840FGZ0_9SPHN|nr:glycosyltransferase [Sphingomonas jinjuensis]MBB4154984.1 alpha-1,6-mannosyltransferase [Sphingomonas jinjuensis]